MALHSLLEAQADTRVEVTEVVDARAPWEMFSEVVRRPYSCFLDSSLSMARFGEHSFIGFDPYLVLLTRGGAAILVDREGREHLLESDPFDALRAVLASRTCSRPGGGLPPFLSGGIGFLSYELGRYIERLPCGVTDDLRLPELGICFYDRVLACDIRSGRKWVAVTTPPGNGSRSAVAETLARLEPGAGRDLTPHEPPRAEPGCSMEFESGFTRERYLESVRAVKEYILAGDIYQANLSQRFSAPLLEPAWDLYRRLRVLNAAPFSAYLNFGDFAVASSSPERFLRLEGREVETRPIKGTMPRFDDPEEDEASRRTLLGSKKDRAELSMIVDLERNDLGRVCEYGSVRVTEHAVLESYATVHHLVSTVTGRLHGGRDLVDLLKATYPGGSITGAPKIRSMEIIDELEPTARSVYTGSIGWMGFDGDADLNIAIRTMIITGGRVYSQVGGGIVADSDPVSEYEETLHKGRAMFAAVTRQCLD
ncbi:MAG: aminodeoxychorismate synthase component I [Actinobacteria bacterium]|nr:aminodeoxychorismate synthase component I [Actinomycetota bacterium]MBU1943810.1 aminodeoxychorismate synthase component I [Actinomycetota bacterium]MBU2689029.1 aminodeoxychorismate synthase component I [Actinomycetota bacterium]